MRKIFFIFLILISFIILPKSLLAKELEKTYLSPDEKYVAIVIPIPKAQYGSGESKIEIRSQNGVLLFTVNYGSEDGEHGFGVERASWTPDSQFFVFSMSSSGGHQAWHFPTDFIAVHDFKIWSLDDYLGTITDPDFVLRDTDFIKTVGRKATDLEETIFDVRLSEIIKK